ncbi:AAA domain-containing protein [Dichotomopilus funicola]|uniref:AAA domain-containing protein n=1 Tax=Dichotomopilus funicola TaxID=1934379 RepID=A0AAN6ZNV7_9PEZI|nr:AAA domain-containing protein [Dichotomopilus funicola]
MDTSKPPPSIYIVGAQCTGKTTLVNNLRAYFASAIPSALPPAIVTEVARTVLQTHHFTARDVRIPARSLELQRLILQAQAIAERAAAAATQTKGEAGPGWFISDRSGADPIAYAIRYVGSDATQDLINCSEWSSELRDRMRASVVVVCEASGVAAGWLTDDGVRLMPRDLGEWVGFHEMFCEFLKGQGIGYHVLKAEIGGHQDRVKFVVQRWREKLGEGNHLG